jgi:ATP-binding protein involved in chromosome partitioning
VTAAIIVTTPQDLALLDARRAYEMFKKVNVPVLGIIENMSHHICSQCGHQESIFGEGGGEKLAEQYDLEFLGALPLDKQIREQTDSGNPTVAAEPDGANAIAYRTIARRITAKLSNEESTTPFPIIEIKND